MPHKDCLSIDVCGEACGYIYKQCKNTRKLNSDDYVIDPGVYPNRDEFCRRADQLSRDGHPCYNPSGLLVPTLSVATLIGLFLCVAAVAFV